MERNYFYKILGVSPSASKQEIDEGFHRVIKIYHPDSGSSNDEMVKDILHAYNILSDEQKRKAYDQAQLDGNSQEMETSFSSVAKQEQQGGSDWIQRDYDSKERREMIKRLSEAEHSVSEIENMISWAINLRPELKEKTGWLLFGLSIPAYIIANFIWGEMEKENMMTYMQANISAIFLAFVAPSIMLIWLIRNIIKNIRVKNYNKKEIVRIEQEREKTIAQAGELFKMEEARLSVLPKRFQYAKAFKGIRELIEDGRADSMKEAINLYEQTKYQQDVLAGIHSIGEQLNMMSDAMRDMKVDVTVW